MAWRNDSVAIFHLPKTGGTWGVPVLKDSLGGKWEHFAGKHSPIEDELEYVGSRKAITFIRHPLGWYWSYWRFSMGRIPGSGDWPHDKNGAQRWMDKIDDVGMACGGSFDRFVNGCLDTGPILTDMYSHFLGKTRRVDLVCRQERLSQDIALAIHLLGGRCVVQGSKRANVSLLPPEKCEWLNADTIKRFVDLEGDMTVALGYDCGPDTLTPERLM